MFKCWSVDRTAALLDRIAAAGVTTILYVTHHADEMPACIKRRLDLPGR